tara:strand:+ start:3423 stop:4013 length:591 start_codon:yes stop_codon:yes gene_type:complete
MHEEKIIFGTPLVLYPINDKTLNKELEKLALHQLKTQPLKVLSNEGGKQTHAPDLNHPVLKKFFTTISPFLNQFVSMYDFKNKFKITVSNLWFNLNKKESFNIQHAHGQCDFSCVYWIKYPPNSGRLIFINPDSTREFIHWSTLPVNNYNVFNSAVYKVNPTTMTLGVFPAQLQHYVEPNKSKAGRLSMAFNLLIQ